MRDDELDVLLSAMTSVEADPRLASRVVRAIEAPADRPRRAWWPAVAAIAAAAAVLLSIGITWRASQQVAGPNLPTAPAVSDLWGRALALPSTDAMWDLASASAPALPSRPRAVRVVPEEDPWPYRLPALERSAPLAIAAIDREEIRTPEIGVQPLSIEPLEIESLER